MNKPTLYGLASDLAQLENLMDFSESELNENEIADNINQISTLLKEKVDNVVYYKFSIEDQLEAVTKRLADIQKVKKSLENKLDKYEEYVNSALDVLKVEEVKGSLCSIKKRKPSKIVNLTDESKIPLEFMEKVVTIKYDKKAIKDAISKGEIIEGAELVDGKQSIIFKESK